jgi:hypothetical protein
MPSGAGPRRTRARSCRCRPSYRDKAHLQFVASRPCLVSGPKPADPHHLRFAQVRALGRKVSDEFAVPLCRTHHRELHRSGNEFRWLEATGIDPLKIARKLWKNTRLNGLAGRGPNNCRAPPPPFCETNPIYWLLGGCLNRTGACPQLLHVLGNSLFTFFGESAEQKQFSSMKRKTNACACDFRSWPGGTGRRQPDCDTFSNAHLDPEGSRR